MDSEYESLKMYSDSTPLINIESKECFICREGEEMGRDGLLHFCDCKNLFAHQKCLLTWIQKSLHNENVPTCKVCTAEYQLEKKSPWRFLATQWHQWVVLCTALVLMISTPFLVYQMIVAFKDPPPGLLFNVAAICVGALTEILLTKCLINYCTSNLEKARMSSFSIRARTA
ncbi:uncharacterized protein LOC120299681 isoform X2 [Crotalus tigris]|uniref:uncharacterized protein LOC120299681 isoform X2 n=1 Tax=Crotalus tigris TaxID=88082 RepID=UPI00192FAC74|nr:uncharacterized protein LOC120299681 isoform X2 [Crotalus tigris]